MWLLRMLYLQIFCLQYLFKDSLSAPQCTSYIDLEGKRGTNCSHRSLESVPHPLPPDTEILLLNYNNLPSVPLTSFQSLPYLKDLDLSHNQIQLFDPVSPLPLEKLDLSSNSLTSIPDFRNLRNLKKLVLNYNQIPDLPAGAFDVLVSLEALSIKGNAIRVIPDGTFDQLEELTHLILSGNRIERFPGNSLQGAQNLDTFDISNNSLSSVPQDFVNIFAPYIYLYNNPWHCDCDTVENFAEWIRAVDGSIYDSIGLSDSKSVVCSGPPGWKDIPIIEFPLERICHIVTTIGTVPQTPTGTERSHISISTVNLFKTSPPPDTCASYTDLGGKRGTNCSHRSLESIPHPLPPDTEILLLNYNNLPSVPLTSFQSLPYLKDLDLSHNQIQLFDPVSPLPLEKLDLSSNSLTSIPDFRNLRNLKKLVLNYNQIPDLPAGAFDVLVSLEALSIKGNAIRVIPDGTFDQLEELTHLILSGNRIERFPGNSLQGAQNLDTFDISNNSLSSVPQDFVNISAPYIYLYNNPWHCDCDTVENFAEWIRAVDGSIYDSIGLSDSKSVVCSSPPGWKDIPIIECPLEQICHVVTTIGTVPQTPTGTERSHISISTVNLFKTSPPPDTCASYTDLGGKRGTNCSHRSLESIPHPLPPDTEILLLNCNNLSSVPLTSFQSLPYLKDLDLSHNQIQLFDPVSPLPLEKLDLSSNSLNRIPDFRNLRNLKKLVLNYNQIPDLPAGAFDVLVSLEALSIKGNAIRVIPDGTFDQLEELTHLILSGNRIERFPGNSLQGAQNLDTFDISNNSLSSVPQDFVNISAPYIYLYNNPWHCDCDTVENFAEWIRAVDGSIYDSIGLSDSKSVVCSSPPGWKDIPIIECPLEQICHVVTTIGTVPQTPTGTERSHISISTVNLFKTSPPPDTCASYTDLGGKRGTNCSHRSLESIPHPLPPDTEILLLNYNNLSSVSSTSFQSLPYLNDLDLSHNQIQHFDPDSPLPLEKLDLSSNSLTGIPEFKNLRNLRKLVLDRNQIPDLPAGAFDVLVSLEELSIKGNAIRVIPDGIFDSLGDLRHLILSGNRIETFPENSLRGAQNLDTFDISNNSLSSVPQDFVNISAPYIYLYNNPWHCDCDTVPNLIEWIQFNSGSFYDSIGQSDSKSVVCSGPPGWKDIPIIEFPLERICHIVTTIGTVPQTPTGTERSHISTSTVNLFKTSPPPEICASYTDLEGKRGTNCSHRSLESVPHPLPPDTEILLLNCNNLPSVSSTSFQSLPYLKDLDLSHNQIQLFDPDSPLPLEKLDLSSNSLTGIPEFKNLRNLRKLVLDRNQIPDLPERAFDDLVSLEELSVKVNAIRVIPDGIFDPLGNLRHLILSGNRIERFPNNSLHSMRNLTTLDISNNQIRTIPREIFWINPALCLLLFGNPLHCNCDVQYLIEWMELMERAMSCGNGTFDDKGIICKTPISVEGRPLFQLSPSELCKSSTPGYGALTVHSSPQATSRSHPTSASPKDAVNRWGRMFGLLEALGPWGSSCYLLFLLHCLALALVLLANCLLLLSVARFHRRCLVPMRDLARRPFGIKLVRYSLLLPDPRQIYPAPSPDSEPGGRERQLLDDDLTPSISGRGSPPPSGEGSH